MGAGWLDLFRARLGRGKNHRSIFARADAVTQLGLSPSSGWKRDRTGDWSDAYLWLRSEPVGRSLYRNNDHSRDFRCAVALAVPGSQSRCSHTLSGSPDRRSSCLLAFEAASLATETRR